MSKDNITEDPKDSSIPSELPENKKDEQPKKPIALYLALTAIIALLIILIAVISENTKLRKEVLPSGSDVVSTEDAPSYSASGNTGEQSTEVASSAESQEASGEESKENTSSESTEASSEESKAESTEGSKEESKETASSESSQAQEESKTESKEENKSEGTFVLTYSCGNSWETADGQMGTVEIGVTNNSGKDLSSWTLVLTIDGLNAVEGWNGTYTADGNTLTIKNADHNGSVANGSAFYTGCNLGTAKALKITSATLNGTACTIKAGTVNQNEINNNQQGGQNNDQSGRQDGNQSSSETSKVDTAALLENTKNAVSGDDWLHTDGNKILDKDGKQVWLTGVNWFGYNTGTNTFDGLWNSKLEPTVKAIADHGFNLIRVPISAQLINQWAAGEYPRANYNNAYNTTLNSMNSLEIFDYFLSLATANGIKVMPDIHSAETDASGHNVNLWYTSKVSVDQYYAALEWMAERYKDNDTIIAYDLKNEPHGKPNEGKNAAIWNNSKDANNWKYVAETAAAKVLAKNPNVLILVEGTEIYPKNSNGDYSSTNSADYYFNWWGGNLRAVKDFPINLGKYQDKLVYSPHDYGPTVYEQPWFQGGYTYESLMKDCWYDNWLYIHDTNTAPLLIGEWGGFMREPNLTWMTYLRQLIKTYHLNHTFWCLNANSGDTGGLLLDDFTTWDDAKYKFVKEVLWTEGGKFVGLDHAIPLGENGITTTAAKGL